VYGIAYYAGKPFLERWGKWLALNWSDVEKVQQKFSGTAFDEISLVVARSIPVVPSVVISAFCGLIRFPIRDYVAYTFLGTLIRASVLGFAGWQIGELYTTYAHFINLFEKGILGLVILGVIAFIVWRRVRAKSAF
jgi:membrane protein DedA with SNARE-associated domain